MSLHTFSSLVWRSRRSQKQPGAARSCQGQPKAAKSRPEQPGAPRSCQGKPGAARSRPEQPEAARAARSGQEQPDAARSSQEQARATRSSQSRARWVQGCMLTFLGSKVCLQGCVFTCGRLHVCRLMPQCSGRVFQGCFLQGKLCPGNLKLDSPRSESDRCGLLLKICFAYASYTFCNNY